MIDAVDQAACHICEEREGVAEFCVQVKAVGVGTDGTAHRWINVRGRACARCHDDLKRFHRRRIALGVAGLTVAFTGWYPLYLAFDEPLGRLAFLVALIIPCLPFVALFLWVGSVERRIIERLRDGHNVEWLRDLVPDAGGVFGWREIRVFPNLPRGQEFVSLEDVGEMVGSRTGSGPRGRDDMDDRAARIRKWKQSQGTGGKKR
jgi:hypothetical protein